MRTRNSGIEASNLIVLWLLRRLPGSGALWVASLRGQAYVEHGRRWIKEKGDRVMLATHAQPNLSLESRLVQEELLRVELEGVWWGQEMSP